MCCVLLKKTHLLYPLSPGVLSVRRSLASRKGGEANGPVGGDSGMAAGSGENAELSTSGTGEVGGGENISPLSPMDSPPNICACCACIRKAPLSRRALATLLLAVLPSSVTPTNCGDSNNSDRLPMC